MNSCAKEGYRNSVRLQSMAAEKACFLLLLLFAPHAPPQQQDLCQKHTECREGTGGKCSSLSWEVYYELLPTSAFPCTEQKKSRNSSGLQAAQKNKSWNAFVKSHLTREE